MPDSLFANLGVGPAFAYQLGAGLLFLIFVVAAIVGVQLYGEWRNKQGAAWEHREHLKLSAFEKARLHNELKARSMRPAVRLAAHRERMK